MPRKCRFNDSWLYRDHLKDWLSKVTSDLHSAYCKLCCKEFSIATLGIAAVTSHANGASINMVTIYDSAHVLFLNFINLHAPVMIFNIIKLFIIT